MLTIAAHVPVSRAREVERQYVDQAQQHVHDLIKDLLTEVAATGGLRDDVAPDELASYCVYSLSAASSLPSEAAVRRLVTVTLAGLRPER